MIVYNKYTNLRDHVWYSSSNIVYSECIDSDTEFKTLKIVFKEGRTYMYRDVDVEDYIRFKNAESNGKAFNQFIKKYECVRMPDTDAATLDGMMKSFQEEDQQTTEAFSNLQYTLSVDNKTGEFTLKLNGKDIFSGIEGQVSIVRLLRSMNIAYAMVEAEEEKSKEDGSEGETTDVME